MKETLGVFTTTVQVYNYPNNFIHLSHFVHSYTLNNFIKNVTNVLKKDLFLAFYLSCFVTKQRSTLFLLRQQ